MGLVIRNCDIGLVSGDSVQFDPDRGVWDDVLVENCTLWTGPLPPLYEVVLQDGLPP
jgi:hypothetical protein